MQSALWRAAYFGISAAAGSKEAGLDLCRQLELAKEAAKEITASEAAEMNLGKLRKENES